MPIPLDPSCPFPLLDPSSYTLEQAQLHAAEVDAWLGLGTDAVEQDLIRSGRYPSRSPDSHSLLGDHVETWTGLPVQSMLTPYVELRSLLHELSPKPRATIVDLGAGYSRMAWVIGEHYPEVSFIGYELIEQRVAESLRCLDKKYPRVRIFQADLSLPGFKPETADYYFLYDFGSRSAIEKCLQDLREIARTQPITVVGRGRSSRDAIERNHPWLSQVVAPRHKRTYSIYSTA